MTLLNTINVGGTDFGLLNNTVMGVCSTPAGSEVKACTFADSFELKAGVVVTIKFTYANTYGNGSTTYPKLSINGVTGAIRDASGTYASNGCWNNQSLVPLLFDGTDFMLLINNVTDTVALNNMYSVTSSAVSKCLGYSFEEHKTGRYWTDGKPTYERIITATINGDLSGYVVIQHNIANIDTPLRIVFGRANLPDNPTDFVTIPLQFDSTTFIMFGQFTKTFVSLCAGTSNWTTLRQITLDLEYTKTTD